MTQWLLRVEGVNFDATVDDTNDLSTSRGGSLTLLRVGQVVTGVLDEHGIEPTPVFEGASQCAYQFPASHDDATKVRQAVEAAFRRPGWEAPFQHLTFVVDVATGKDAPAALRHAEAKNKARQFRQWTVTPQPFHADAVDADPLETIRPGTVPERLPPGRVLLANEPRPFATHEKHRLSAGVAARRDFGRKARQGFYRRELGREVADSILGSIDTNFSFTNQFRDIVADPKPELPISVGGKLAVFYADGNSFGAIREKVGVGVFSKELRALRRKLLQAVLKWYVSGAKGGDWAAFAVRDDRLDTLGLRFETLMWGGDETLFVMPAWLAFSFISGFLKVTKDWQIGGDKLTHAIGVAIADDKTPIRQLKSIAKKAADLAKDADLRNCNTVTFEIYESLAPPDTELATARARLFGTATDDAAAERLARLLALPGDAFEQLVEGMRTLTGADGGAAFPRSQLYNALRAARTAGDLTGEDAASRAQAALDHFARRPEGKALCQTLFDALPPSCGEKRPLALDLSILTQFWDYAVPLDGRLPDFGGLGAV